MIIFTWRIGLIWDIRLFEITQIRTQFSKRSKIKWRNKKVLHVDIVLINTTESILDT